MNFSEYKNKLESEQRSIEKRLAAVRKRERIWKEEQKVKKEKEDKLQTQLTDLLKNDKENITISINFSLEHCGSCCGSESDHLDEHYIKVNLIEILWYLSNYCGLTIDNKDFFEKIDEYLGDFLQRYCSHPTKVDDEISYKVFKSGDKILSGDDINLSSRWDK
jgi:hypothetical protein